MRRTGVVLAGSIDNINQVFVAPDKFIHESGIRSVEVYYNGQRLLETDDYTVSESGGVGTGYDTVTMQIAPRSHGTNIDKVWADYWVRVGVENGTISVQAGNADLAVGLVR